MAGNGRRLPVLAIQQPLPSRTSQRVDPFMGFVQCNEVPSLDDSHRSLAVEERIVVWKSHELLHVVRVAEYGADSGVHIHHQGSPLNLVAVELHFGQCAVDCFSVHAATDAQHCGCLIVGGAPAGQNAGGQFNGGGRGALRVQYVGGLSGGAHSSIL